MLDNPKGRGKHVRLRRLNGQFETRIPESPLHRYWYPSTRAPGTHVRRVLPKFLISNANLGPINLF